MYKSELLATVNVRFEDRSEASGEVMGGNSITFRGSKGWPHGLGGEAKCENCGS